MTSKYYKFSEPAISGHGTPGDVQIWHGKKIEMDPMKQQTGEDGLYADPDSEARILESSTQSDVAMLLHNVLPLLLTFTTTKYPRSCTYMVCQPFLPPAFVHVT